MQRIKVVGAGSAGNHIAHAFRLCNWEVWLTDSDEAALERTRSTTYPSRYGLWHDNIHLSLSDASDVSETAFDVVAIATPPESHCELALAELRNNPPKILLIEKPLAATNDPLLRELIDAAKTSDTQVLVGYNHNLSDSLAKVVEVLKSGLLGKIHSINVDVRESSNFILGAHPWLGGVQDSYLGSVERAGGAGFEHSHGVAMWLHLAEAAQLPVANKIYASQRLSADESFDEATSYFFENENGNCGCVNQDFVASPPLKRAEIFGDKGRISWCNVFKANHEEVIISTTESVKKLTFPKQRATDFVKEVEHIEDLLTNRNRRSSISLEHGLKVMQILELGLKSATEHKPLELS